MMVAAAYIVTGRDCFDRIYVYFRLRRRREKEGGSRLRGREVELHFAAACAKLSTRDTRHLPSDPSTQTIAKLALPTSFHSPAAPWRS